VTWCSPTNLRAPTASPAPLVPQTPLLSEHQLSALGDAITSELLPVEEAQKLKVHKFSKFFSEEDIKLIFDFKHAQGNSLGTTRRGNTGMKALDSPW
jgi:ADP-dependent phosphofructokinase/glucokinase